MSELEDRINSVLSDPEQMEQIMGLAKSLMGGEEQTGGAEGGGLGDIAKALLGGGDGGASESGPELAMFGRLAELMKQGGGRGEEQALVEAMKPYLSEKRRGKLDRAMKLARMARLAQIALGEGGPGHV